MKNTTYKSEYRVSMRNIDVFGHVHNSVYLDYCEDAVSDFLRNHEIYTHFSHKNSETGYLVKKIEVTFFNPLEVEDTVSATVSVQKIGNTSLTFEIAISRERDKEHCATCQLIWVCVKRKTGSPIPIPEETRLALTNLCE